MAVLLQQVRSSRYNHVYFLIYDETQNIFIYFLIMQAHLWKHKEDIFLQQTQLLNYKYKRVLKDAQIVQYFETSLIPMTS